MIRSYLGVAMYFLIRLCFVLHCGQKQLDLGSALSRSFNPNVKVTASPPWSPVSMLPFCTTAYAGGLLGWITWDYTQINLSSSKSVPSRPVRPAKDSGRQGI